MLATPALDALAEEGVVFEECYSASNYTNPSHVALLTGTHPLRTGVVSNKQRLNDTPTTLAELYRDAGYTTWAIVSARHLYDDISGLGQGFDRMYGPEGAEHRAADAVEKLQGWLEQRDGRPVFVWLHLFDAHWPYDPPRTDPETRAPDLASTEPGTQAQEPGSGEEGRGGIGDPTLHLANYRGEVTYLDDQLSRLFAAEPFADGITAITSDHGESLGENGTWFSHSGLYPSTLHVPLILRYPGAPAGRRVAQRTPSIDLGVTLLELSGLPAKGFPGESLLPLLQGGGARSNYALHGNGVAISLTTPQNEHLVITLDMRSEKGHLVEHAGGVRLFDLAADPGCITDVSDDDPKFTMTLRQELRQWMNHQTPLPWLDTSGPQHGQLESLLETLGYADGGGGGAPTGQ